ncbi:MAG: O-antigen ligase family protein [Halobacteriovoraceae bacterium]|nr:O-antigen ligase family protein [Halobacteriovoraceae bacterium]
MHFIRAKENYSRLIDRHIKPIITNGNFIEFLLALSILKRPMQHNLFFNAIPLLFGLGHLLFLKKVNKLFWPYLIMLGIGIANAFVLGECVSLIRIGQVICLISFAHFSCEYISKDNLKKICEYIVYIGGIQLLLEIIIHGPVGLPKMYFGFSLPRFEGPIGESNYSGLIFGVACMVHLSFKKYYFALFSFLGVIASVSRTTTVMIIFFLAFYLLLKLSNENIRKYWSIIVVCILSTTPIVVYLLYHHADYEVLDFIEKKSSGRFFLLVPYLNMGIENIFGVGYFRGIERYPEYLEPIIEFTSKFRKPQINEQHNIFMQVFSEFGPIGYVPFLIFLLQLFFRVSYKKEDLWKVAILMSLFIGFSFLNGLNSFSLYLLLGFCLKNNSEYILPKFNNR